MCTACSLSTSILSTRRRAQLSAYLHVQIKCERQHTGCSSRQMEDTSHRLTVSPSPGCNLLTICGAGRSPWSGTAGFTEATRRGSACNLCDNRCCTGSPSGLDPLDPMNLDLLGGALSGHVQWAASWIAGRGRRPQVSACSRDGRRSAIN